VKYCAFCALPETEVPHLVACPILMIVPVCICSDCIKICVRVLADHGAAITDACGRLLTQ